MAEGQPEHRLDRRAAIKKVAVGGAVAGLAWTAPRVEQLTIRPDYAAAQTVPDPNPQVNLDLRKTVVGAPPPTGNWSFELSSPDPACLGGTSPQTVTIPAAGGVTTFALTVPAAGCQVTITETPVTGWQAVGGPTQTVQVPFGSPTVNVMFTNQLIAAPTAPAPAPTPTATPAPATPVSPRFTG